MLHAKTLTSLAIASLLFAGACAPKEEPAPGAGQAAPTLASPGVDTAAARTAAADSGAVTLASAGSVAPLPTMTVYKSPSCGCCKGWVEHAERAGFTVAVRDTADVSPVKRAYGVDPKLYSCHTTVVGGYVVEGHVPLEDVKRMLAERPRIAGIAAPGMPVGSPGMEQGTQKDPFDVIAFTKDGATSVYAKH